MTPAPVEEQARRFLTWHLTSGTPSWREALARWPGARGLTAAELWALRVEVVRLIAFHDGDQAAGAGR